MKVWQINVVYQSDEADDSVIRDKLEALLDGSGFGVACVERDYEADEDDGED